MSLFAEVDFLSDDEHDHHHLPSEKGRGGKSSIAPASASSVPVAPWLCRTPCVTLPFHRSGESGFSIVAGAVSDAEARYSAQAMSGDAWLSRECHCTRCEGLRVVAALQRVAQVEQREHPLLLILLDLDNYGFNHFKQPVPRMCSSARGRPACRPRRGGMTRSAGSVVYAPTTMSSSSSNSSSTPCRESVTFLTDQSAAIHETPNDTRRTVGSHRYGCSPRYDDIGGPDDEDEDRDAVRDIFVWAFYGACFTRHHGVFPTVESVCARVCRKQDCDANDDGDSCGGSSNNSSSSRNRIHNPSAQYSLSCQRPSLWSVLARQHRLHLTPCGGHKQAADGVMVCVARAFSARNPILVVSGDGQLLAHVASYARAHSLPCDPPAGDFVCRKQDSRLTECVKDEASLTGRAKRRCGEGGTAQSASPLADYARRTDATHDEQEECTGARREDEDRAKDGWPKSHPDDEETGPREMISCLHVHAEGAPQLSRIWQRIQTHVNDVMARATRTQAVAGSSSGAVNGAAGANARTWQGNTTREAMPWQGKLSRPCKRPRPPQ